MTGASIGKNCTFGQNVNISNNVKIGDGCKVQNSVSIYEGVELENNVFCGPSCIFMNTLTPRAEYPKKHTEYKKTLIKEVASIGANSTIICGHTIGKHAMIAAGAVVSSDVPDHALMIGVPARLRGYVCECGEILTDDLVCSKCGRTYKESGNGLEEA